MKAHFTIACLVLLLGSCGIPRDPDGTFSEARKNGLVVGVVHNPPFCIAGDEGFSGVEVELIEEFARAHDLNAEYVEGCESDLVEELKSGDIHVLAGGFEKSTLWLEKAGATAPYDGTHVLLVAKGENRLVYELESVVHKNRRP